MKCKKGFEIEVLKSGAGYYRGTCDSEGYPSCRLTSSYASSKEQAKLLPLDRQHCLENMYCSGGEGCLCK